MAKYHLNWKGEAGVCRARKNCPFGDLENDHFSSVEDARAAFEENMRVQAASPTLSKTPVAPPKVLMPGLGNASENIREQLNPFYKRKVLVKNGPLTGRVFTIDSASNGGFRGWEFNGMTDDNVFTSVSIYDVTAKLDTVLPSDEPKEEPKQPKNAWEDFKVVDPADSKIIVPPRKNDPFGGYLGGRLFVGGKVVDGVYMTQKDAAKNIRADIKAAVKAGEIPDSLSYSVRMDSGSMVSSINIILGEKNEAGATVEVHEVNEGNENLVKVKQYLESLGKQYTSEDINSGVDYFNSHNSARVRYRNKWD